MEKLQGFYKLGYVLPIGSFVFVASATSLDISQFDGTIFYTVSY